MRYSSSVRVPASTALVIPYVHDLGRYPEWMPLVHSAVPVEDETWDVELRAKVGIFARSKRLRMTRTETIGGGVTFERREIDGRRHSPWTLRADVSSDGDACIVTMDLSYGGSLWTGGVLDRVLASHVEEGKAGLVGLFQTA